MPKPTKYERVIEKIFTDRFDGEVYGFDFPRNAINEATDALNLKRISNVGDVIYTYKARRYLPQSIQDTAAAGRTWVVRTVGTSQYRFDQVENGSFAVDSTLAATLVPDSTPALIQMYRQSDEQSLLATVRYNRLIDIFTRLSCFSVQNHLRTNLAGTGQIEVDELYVGIDRVGAHYVLPIEVKSASDMLGYNQIANMFELCSQRFPDLIARPMGAQFIDSETIALMEFQQRPLSIEIDKAEERHYRLVPADELPREVVEEYGRRAIE